MVRLVQPMSVDGGGFSKDYVLAPQYIISLYHGGTIVSAIERQKYLHKITQRLVIFTGTVLCIIAVGLYILYSYIESNEHSYLVLLVFASGLLGGFVSIQQRLPKITVDELKILSSSWFSITLIPINGGVFALVLMIMFVGNIIQGSLFPSYPDFDINDFVTFKMWLTLAYPVSGTNVAKLLFWSFVAGFSERFVPQIIRRTVDEATSDKPAEVPNDVKDEG